MCRELTKIPFQERADVERWWMTRGLHRRLAFGAQRPERPTGAGGVVPAGLRPWRPWAGGAGVSEHLGEHGREPLPASA